MYSIGYNQKLKKLSQDLRREMTDAERILWSKIRRRQIRGLHFYRQKPILNYIVDFYCPKARIIIEIDGGQHYEGSNVKKDQKRDLILAADGFKVLRFTNLDILYNLENVLIKIVEEIKSSPALL